MEWQDSGILLSVRRHGESAAIISVLTRDHGRHHGLVHGGGGRRAAGMLQPGNALSVRWRARLEDHLGSFACDLDASHAAAVLDDPLRLAALSAACAIVEFATPEREAMPDAHAGLCDLIARLPEDGWMARHVRWELALLTELGFGLDLTACAATGLTEGLTHVSPRSGRAVSTQAAAPYKGRLLPLPAFLADAGAPAGPEAILDGLRLTGHFLEHHVAAAPGKPLPAARTRLVDAIRRVATISS